MSTAELVLDPPAPYVHLGDHVWLGASPQDTDTLHKNGSDGQGKYVLASSDSTRLGGLTLNWCEQTNPPTLSNISTAMFEFRPRTVVEMDADEDEHNNNQHQPQQHSHHQPHQQKQPAAEHKKRKEVQAEYDHSDEDVRFCKGYAVTCGQAVTLYHPHSRRYVAVKRNTPARTEPSNLRVVLVGDPSKASNFKIQPSSKLRVEGDPVLTDDKISLECADIPDHFLNKSVKPNEGKDSCVFEVNCAVTRTEFTIREAAAVKHRRYPLQYHPYQDDGRRIRGCDMVQLYHRGLSAYMAAEGSFALDEPVVNDREGEEDVHLRLRPQNKRQPRTLRPPTTAVTFWQVELVNNSCWGRPVQWEHDPDLDRFKTQPLRLKHATTQLFLSFDDNLKPRLQRNPDDSTSFQLAQLDDDTSVSSCATVGIQHVKSEQWLYAEFNSDKDRFKRKEAEESIARWDGATLVKLKLRERGGTREFCDVFQVTLVKPSQVFSVGFVAGALPAIATYIKGLAGEQVGSAALAPKAFTSGL
ncbi:hypothetical protein PTSG_04689 [Salpingoeca rosetta]|uniref:MIR domain-containing protein n=1 Tax=Salpingoeca rosetta (strain ATCC 50818 / BSB-021) TaxID=946362 RepID=F2U853_SALR5|nr:uncharacterized protein PTSG_04689 [Salpingoeca rosetta]EGD72958.1 hypothetical protein PTSG_04689 [Salpingoeca rosetta]|eukprot:XP_004994780.1 hypothetical protein PTSG_04689 [Salpingoeca rosetta]